MSDQTNTTPARVEMRTAVNDLLARWADPSFFEVLITATYDLAVDAILEDDTTSREVIALDEMRTALASARRWADKYREAVWARATSDELAPTKRDEMRARLAR